MSAHYGNPAALVNIRLNSIFILLGLEIAMAPAILSRDRLNIFNMRHEFKVRVRISVSRRPAILGMAGALLLAVAPEIGSESVILATYHPSPSGIYTKMIVTGDPNDPDAVAAELARNNGIVSLASKATDKKIRLVISQNNALQIGTPIPNGDYTGGTGGFISSGGDYLRMSNRAWHNGSEWQNDTGNSSIMELGPQGIYFLKHAGGTSAIMAYMNESGGGGYIKVDHAAGCRTASCTPGIGSCVPGGTMDCLSGEYPTFVPGIASQGLTHWTYNADIKVVSASGWEGDTVMVLNPDNPTGPYVQGRLRLNNDVVTYLCCAEGE
ncbi:MAG: hypothetical protein PHF00_10745 [Elusimicrobia bacterium]|nr:hypothetical protein [Elusimicrobiota bacterium]